MPACCSSTMIRGRYERGRGWQRHTTYARSLAEVIEHLDRGFVPDLVISDFYLANETGGDVLREIARRCPNARRFLVSSSPESIPLQDAALAAAVLDKGAGAMNELLRDPHERRR